MLGSKEPFDNPVFPRIFLQRLKVTSGHTRPWDEGGCVSLEPSSRNRTSRCRTAPERVKAGADSDFSRGKSRGYIHGAIDCGQVCISYIYYYYYYYYCYYWEIMVGKFWNRSIDIIIIYELYNGAFFNVHQKFEIQWFSRNLEKHHLSTVNSSSM